VILSRITHHASRLFSITTITVTSDAGIGNPFPSGGPRNIQLAFKLTF
jgi:hypothetical protein